MLEFDASISGGEALVDTEGLSIALGLPSSPLAFEFGARADATIQTLPGEHREFDLGHVQPTAVLGGEMQFQLLDQASRLRRLKHLIQGCQGMRVQVIHDQHQLLSSRIVDIHQVANEAGEVRFGTLLGHLQIALARPSVRRPRTDCRCPVVHTHSRSIPAVLAACAEAHGSHSPTACSFHPDRLAVAAHPTVACTPSAPPPSATPTPRCASVEYTTATSARA